jgi:glycosyltransferase involved in cell wall biosynthesis
MSRILYLTSARIPSRAANAVQTLSMCEAFAKNGHELLLVARRGDHADVFDTFGLERNFAFHPVDTTSGRGTRTLRHLSVVRKVEREFRPDVYFGRDVYGLALLADTGGPVVLEVHRSMRGFRVESAVFSWLFRQPNFVKLIVVSQGMRDDYLRTFPRLDPSHIQVLPGAAHPLTSTTTSTSFGGRPGALQVGYIGHLYEGRGIEVIVAAAAALPAHDFHVVGGDEADLARWRAASVPPNVRFHGFFAHAVLRERLGAFDVLLAPYQRRVFVAGGSETSAVMSPLKLFEYMSTGKAIVCSDLPVLREVFTSEENALLVSPDDAGAWVDALRQLEDPNLRQRLGDAAAARFRASHTWQARAHAALSGLHESEEESRHDAMETAR